MNFRLCTSKTVLSVLGGLMLAGCGARYPVVPPLPHKQALGGNLPCEVSKILETRCQSCHSNPPQFGAPMPLVTYSDLSAPAGTGADSKIADLVEQRIHDSARPMPPDGQLPPDELLSLDGWIKSGAKPVDETCTPSDVDAGSEPVGPEFLTCTPDLVMTSYASDGAGKFLVPNNDDDVTQCFPFQVDAHGTRQAIGFAPILDATQLLHHINLYVSSEPQVAGQSFDCLSQMPADATLLASWGPGRGNFLMPDDVGLQMPKAGQWLILQVHYHNLQRVAGVQDQSGMAVCTTDALRPHEASVSTLGTDEIAIPPGATAYPNAGVCTPELTRPVHILNTAVHMHTHGRMALVQVVRGDGSVEPLLDVQHFNSDNQISYETPAVINPGDKILSTCFFDNDSTQIIGYGETQYDEMCYDYVVAWPANQLLDGSGASRGRCIDGVEAGDDHHGPGGGGESDGGHGREEHGGSTSSGPSDGGSSSGPGSTGGAVSGRGGSGGP